MGTGIQKLKHNRGVSIVETVYETLKELRKKIDRIENEFINELNTKRESIILGINNSK